ncbi:group II intron reverse transcriptase/maturase [Candidatus Formimonas warabiya]|uniref:Group II intron reverse transcriptase/maturase n=1 Tax=Formimonas warabiya TaxID=1761012 RepID=A0A3G1KWE3_FORW1|nr:group II intron reverse transcriptase/maturase [Candidatus Formimonas warabiya]ATW26772.1 group II intron reverse transcriptase/maturase [Candidatus Formimonas warabiya]ATW26788.1 group II intron reverse transcriptase/maturase [Candidatus Formimonas warabiya]
METKLTRIAEAARMRPNEKFTSLAHLINEETIKECHREMSRNKASGVDEVTKEEYELNLESNVKDLINRMKRQAYKPQPVRRVHIPKPGSDKKRPLGIPAYEDKLVQSALAKILNAIYEQDFLECSFGFRPGRGCHDAMKILDKILDKREIRYVVDADIRSFFDHVDHEWLMKFLQHRIADPNILRLVARFLRSGIIEAGAEYDTPEGTPQGGCCSPILGNLYLHYVLDLWFEKRVRKDCRGRAYMVRYADDTVFCFQHKEDAKEFYSQMIERLGQFNLEVAEEKTKIISLNKEKDEDNGKDGGGSKQTNSFDFLGFTHYMGEDKNGAKRIKRKTSKKKYRASLLRCKEWIQRNRHMPTKDFMKKMNIKLQGYCRYYGITDNHNAVSNFIDEVKKLIFKWLNRRSQRRSFSWDKYNLFLKKYPLPRAKNYVRIFELGMGSSYVL